jgi:hypothetical protein
MTLNRRNPHSITQAIFFELWAAMLTIRITTADARVSGIARLANEKVVLPTQIIHQINYCRHSPWG